MNNAGRKPSRAFAFYSVSSKELLEGSSRGVPWADSQLEHSP